VQCGAIGFRIDRHGRDPKLVATANKAHGNFATVRDQNFVEEFAHAASMLLD
jgi:hypothetical protein